MKLTPKQNLASELCMAQHNFNPERYAKPDLNDPRWQNHVRYMANHTTQDKLLAEIIFIQNRIKERDHKNAVAVSKERYFKENPDALIVAQNRLEAIRIKAESLENDTVAILNKHIAAHISPLWKIETIQARDARLGINMTHSDEPYDKIGPSELYRFGYTVDLRFAPYRFDGQDEPQCNIGSMGDFGIYGWDPKNPRAEFYKGIGKMLSDTHLLDHLRITMLDYKKQMDSLYAEYDATEKFIDNPENL